VESTTGISVLAVGCTKMEMGGLIFKIFATFTRVEYISTRISVKVPMLSLTE
jgi:hypothetical protein